MSSVKLLQRIQELAEKGSGKGKAAKRAKGDLNDAIFWWLRQASLAEIETEIDKGKQSQIPVEALERVKEERNREREYLRIKSLAEDPRVRDEHRKRLSDIATRQQIDMFTPHMGSLLFVEGWTREVHNGMMFHSRRMLERITPKMREEYLSVVADVENSLV